MKIAIRADGGLQIGMGHIMRTLVLAKELAKTNDVFYICRINNKKMEKYASGIKKIKEYGFNVITISEEIFIEELCKIKADCLITDSYNVDEQYFYIIKKKFKITIYIDDMNLHYFNVDILINQNINAEKLQYKVNKDTKLLLGLDYLMLRDEFRNISKPINKPKIKDIMITIGGSDNNSITNKLCEYIKDLDFKFHIIIGPSFKDDSIKKLVTLSKEKKSIKLYFNANMFLVMKKCDIAISACGSTLYELMACGIPTLGIIVADNQQLIAVNLHNNKVIYNLGWYKNLNKEKIYDKINDLNINKRNLMSNYGRTFIDGKGVYRIAKVINEYKR
ncbi:MULTISPECIES: UDP-2,4-diacetamido-2,4,6-trideoxy-beta-L-altropyranose hydrolase [Clostridium]|uniref:UDP-2,4-diacetamido-2,4, 6-trideoxy-beta-L-altropyranose hydrolase n=1 Tax=Clostridium TaxID=1485 RepID=UPI0008A54BFE|nr:MULTISPECIES: UDP-2,4-diacetamido-2,4,6-trideoxy-beta-L-altropyranose hydrolase [Clostridium]OFS19725.1 UDP-2,4-diacetamido-2,4,6-trideoxy-beta-L-altropyranose hydrolase [Clostridium sp. HMSC19A10]